MISSTPEWVRREIASSEMGIRALARRFGISPTTVRKWKARSSTEDANRGPKGRGPFSLTLNEEKMIDTFRRYTLLPLDDCLHALQLIVPAITRTTLHRCFQRHGIARVPPLPLHERGRIGTFFVGWSEVHAVDQQFFLFFAVDPVSRVIHNEPFDRLDARTLRLMIDGLRAAIPYRIDKIIISNASPVAAALAECGIPHFTVPHDHPWADSLVDRVTRNSSSVPSAMARGEVERLSAEFIAGYSYERRLKALHGRTPAANLQLLAVEAPERFLRDPTEAALGRVSTTLWNKIAVYR